MHPWLFGAFLIPVLQAPIPSAVIGQGLPGDMRVALTFDACSTRMPSEYNQRIIQLLADAQVPATIFIGGQWARAQADNVRALAANPLFELGNHTETHPHLTELTDAQVRDELQRTQDELRALTGKRPTLFRPPFGEYDGRVARIAATMGMRTVMYDVASGDPGRGATREALVSWVLKRARPGSIIVMHINHLRFHTAAALPAIIDGLRARGLGFATVSQLAAGPAAPISPPAIADNRADFPRAGQTATSAPPRAGAAAPPGAGLRGMAGAVPVP